MNKTYHHILDGALLGSGSFIMALAYNLFLIPHKVVPGGVTGISMLLNHVLGTPIGITAIVLNIPLFFVGIRVLGKSYGFKSLVGMLLSSLLIDFFTYVVPLGSATDDIFLACIFGGITLGAGLGLVFKGGGSTGGSDIVGSVLNRVTNLTTGSAILIVDCLVIAAAGLVYANVELSLYGFVNLYLGTRTIDLVLEGVSYTRAVFIVSEKVEELTRMVTQNMGRGATILHGQGAFSHMPKEVILCVMSKKEIPKLRQIVRMVDPQAFIIITDVYEVLGEGFKPRVATLS